MKKTENTVRRGRSKLGRLLDERGLTLRGFAAELYERTGYLINVTNLSNYCTGLKQIRNVEVARKFAEALDVTINDIV